MAAIPKNSWKELKNPKTVYPENGAYYFEFELADGSKAHLLAAYLGSKKWRIRPYLSEKTRRTSDIAKEQGASAAINGAYFNLSDGASASYLVLDGKILADPRKNKALVQNPNLEPFLEQIFNRSEIRILSPEKRKESESDKFKIQIARHDEKLPAACMLIDSIQAGPRLLPKLEAESEAFLRRQPDGSIADSISVNKAAARSAFGLTEDNYAIFLAVSGKGQDPESSGISLQELANLMRSLGCKEAINLDGGSSTTLYLKTSNKDGAVVCGKEPETLVKSVLLLLPQ